jgi:hypothetical protein
VSDRRLVICLLGLALAACELIVDFDSKGARDPRLEPTPIPQLDGAVVVVVDGAIPDGTVVRVPNDAAADAGDASDAARDGAMGAQLDGALDASLDAGADPDASGAFDAAAPDADFMDGAVLVPDASSDAAPATPEDGDATLPPA